MSRRYDSRTTTFSPEGRLFQVEYAMEAIAHAALAIGILARDGAVLAAERRTLSPLLEPSQIDDHVIAAVAGITADAAILIQRARVTALGHRKAYASPMPLELLVQRIGNVKQGYTQFGGLRPFGVSMIWAGQNDAACPEDAQPFQVYASDPSGNYAAWKAIAVGNESAAATSLLKNEYKEDCSLAEAAALAARALRKATTRDPPLSADMIEMSFIRLIDGKPRIDAVPVETIAKALETIETAD